MKAGTTVSFSPNPIAAPGAGTSGTTLAVGSSTAVGTYPIPVTGSGGGIQQSTTVTLTVTVFQVALTWNASVSQVVGYNAYRPLTTGGPYTKLNSSLISATSYNDQTVHSGLTKLLCDYRGGLSGAGEHLFERSCGHRAVVAAGRTKTISERQGRYLAFRFFSQLAKTEARFALQEPNQDNPTCVVRFRVRKMAPKHENPARTR